MNIDLPQWTDLDYLGTTDNKLKFYESYAATNGNLNEANDKEVVKAFERLSRAGDSPEVGSKYIGISLVLMNNELSVAQQPELVKLVEYSDSIYTLELLEQNNRIVEFPIKRDSLNIPIITLLFSSSEKYEKIRIYVKLTFNAELPNYSKQVKENKMSSIMKGIMREEENVVVLYIDDKASTKYPTMADAKEDVERLKKKFPNKKIELKREVRSSNNEKVDEAAFEKDLQDNEPRIVTGVYGAKSKEFTRKFANQAAQDRFFDHPDRQGNYEIHQVKKATVSEGVIISTTQNGNPRNPQIAILGGAGSVSYETLKRKALREAKLLAEDIERGEYKNSTINIKQLENTLKTLVAAEEEMERMYFGESQVEEQSGVKYPVRSLDGVEKAFSNPDSIAARNWASSNARKPKPVSYAPSKIKKPTLDQIWQKVEYAVSMQFPDGEPIDILGPWLNKNGLTIDDVNRAAKKNGYKSMYHYWDALASDYEGDARSDWERSGRKGPEPKIHRFTMADESSVMKGLKRR